MKINHRKSFIFNEIFFQVIIILGILFGAGIGYYNLHHSNKLNEDLSKEIQKLEDELSSLKLKEGQDYQQFINQQRETIDTYIRTSDAVDDVVEEETDRLYDRLLVILGILATLLTTISALVVLGGKAWVREKVKEELKNSKEDFMSDANRTLKENIESTLSLLRILASIKNIQILSDLKFNPIPKESVQILESDPNIFLDFQESLKTSNIPTGLCIELGDVFSLLGKHLLEQADSHHNDQLKKEAKEKFEKAIENYEKALKDIPRDGNNPQFWADVYCKNGNAYAGIGDHSKAIAEYGQALSIDDHYYWAIHSHGDALAAQMRYNEALNKYNEAIDYNINYDIPIPAKCRAETYYKKGVLYAMWDKDTEAIKSYNNSLKLDKYNSWVLLSLGDSYKKLGNYKQAKVYYKRALELNSYQYTTWIALGDVLCNLGGDDNYREAILKYNQALKIIHNNGIGDDYKIQQKLGDAYLRLKEYDSSVMHYTQAIDLGNNFFKLWAYRAYANEQRMNTQEFSDSEAEKKELRKQILNDRTEAMDRVIINYESRLKNLENIFLKYSDRKDEYSDRKDKETAIHYYNCSICLALEHHLDVKNHRDKIFNELTKAKDLHEPCKIWAKTEIAFIPFQEDPEFKELIKKDEESIEYEFSSEYESSSGIIKLFLILLLEKPDLSLTQVEEKY